MNSCDLVAVICLCVITMASSEQAGQATDICKTYNREDITWTCQRSNSCPNLRGTSQEYRCGRDKGGWKKICCPSSKTEGSPLTTEISVDATTLKTTSEPEHINIIKQKCVEFAKARYQIKCIDSFVWNQESQCSLEKDCDITTVPLIVGGQEVREKQFPHMALIGSGEIFREVEWLCGGSLISDRFILTAAHCIPEGRPARWAGLGQIVRKKYTQDALNTSVFRITRAHIHPNYTAAYTNYDIALIELENAVTFSAHIRPVCLYTQLSIPRVTENNATILGWGSEIAGRVASEILRGATISFLADEPCMKYYEDEPKLKNGFDARTMLCAGGDTQKGQKGLFNDTCHGDSGGPIQINHKDEECMYMQVGITAMGPRFCGNGSPAMYTRVYPYLEWIQKIVWPQEGPRTSPKAHS